MTRPGPPHESMVRTGRGGGGDSAEWRMRGREAGAGSPEGRPIRPLPGAAGPLGVGPEACGAAVTQPAASSAGSRGRASPAPALCPCLRHPAAPCRSASHPRHRGTSLGAAGAAGVPSPGHPPPSPPPLPARCARTAPFPRCPRARGPRRPSFSRARLRPETLRQPTHPRGLGVPALGPRPPKPHENSNSQLPACHRHLPGSNLEFPERRLGFGGASCSRS